MQNKKKMHTNNCIFKMLSEPTALLMLFFLSLYLIWWMWFLLWIHPCDNARSLYRFSTLLSSLPTTFLICKQVMNITLNLLHFKLNGILVGLCIHCQCPGYFQTGEISNSRIRWHSSWWQQVRMKNRAFKQ